MSEINSIANGTYTIGETSATNFIAGPGITIDQPSAGTVRIGNDDTVLFSGTAATSVTCSETLSNYSRCRVYVKSNSFPTLNEVEFDVADSTVGCFFMANGVHGYGAQISVSSATVATSNGIHVWFQNGGMGSESVSIVITKVIGINRISGGNA